MAQHAAVITDSAREQIVNDTNTVAANLAAHAALDWSGHGASVQAAEYKEDPSLDVAAHLVIRVETSLGVLYIPCSTSPSGV